MKHASQQILSDLDKMDDRHASEIRRVAGADLTGSSPLGASRVLPARDMARKMVSGTVIANRPSPIAPPRTGSTKPPHTWPAPTAFKTESGLARPGRLGTMPSRDAPRRDFASSIAREEFRGRR
jgi:hypothetical protein